MERRWPLGLGLVLLLCTPLPPGARTKEGTNPRPRAPALGPPPPRSHPLPGPGQHPPAEAGIPQEALFPETLASSLAVPDRRAVDWPGSSLVFNPKRLLSRVSHPNSRRPAIGAWE